MCTFVHTISCIQGLGKVINSQFCQSNFNFHTLRELKPNVIRGKSAPNRSSTTVSLIEKQRRNTAVVIVAAQFQFQFQFRIRILSCT